MENVLTLRGGWDSYCTDYVTLDIKKTLEERLIPKDEEEVRRGLRMSNLGSPCKRKLWYEVNEPADRKSLAPADALKFLYGDIVESIVLGLVTASGHSLYGEQDELEIGGIKGHRDCIIDGITVDIKTASAYGFRKFKSGNLRNDDPFGYISQLSSYVYAGNKADPENVHPSLGAFLVVDKTTGELHLDLYNLAHEVDEKEKEIEALKEMVASPDLPLRPWKDEPIGKSGNRTIPKGCTFCNKKKDCWKTIRAFQYQNNVSYLTKVARLPKATEIPV